MKNTCKIPMLKISEDVAGNINVLDMSNRAYNIPIGRVVRKDDQSYCFKRTPFTASLSEAQEEGIMWLLYEMEHASTSDIKYYTD